MKSIYSRFAILFPFFVRLFVVGSILLILPLTARAQHSSFAGISLDQTIDQVQSKLPPGYALQTTIGNKSNADIFLADNPSLSRVAINWAKGDCTVTAGVRTSDVVAVQSKLKNDFKLGFYIQEPKPLTSMPVEIGQSHIGWLRFQPCFFGVQGIDPREFGQQLLSKYKFANGQMIIVPELTFGCGRCLAGYILSDELVLFNIEDGSFEVSLPTQEQRNRFVAPAAKF